MSHPNHSVFLNKDTARRKIPGNQEGVFVNEKCSWVVKTTIADAANRRKARQVAQI